MNKQINLDKRKQAQQSFKDYYIKENNEFLKKQIENKRILKKKEREKKHQTELLKLSKILKEGRDKEN